MAKFYASKSVKMYTSAGVYIPVYVKCDVKNTSKKIHMYTHVFIPIYVG